MLRKLNVLDYLITNARHLLVMHFSKLFRVQHATFRLILQVGLLPLKIWYKS